MQRFSEFDYVLPPVENAVTNLLSGLKKFNDDLASGATDSGAQGFNWKGVASKARAKEPGWKGGGISHKSSAGACRADKPFPNVVRSGQRFRPPLPSSLENLDVVLSDGSEDDVKSPRFCAYREPMVGSGVFVLSKKSGRREQPLQPRLTLPGIKDGSRGASHCATKGYTPSSPSRARSRNLTMNVPRMFQQALDLKPMFGGRSSRLAGSISPQHRDGIIAPPVILEDPASGAPETVEKPGQPQRPWVSPRPKSARDSNIGAEVKISKSAGTSKTLEEWIAKACEELLSGQGCPKLKWRTVHTNADFNTLLPEEFFNHFQNTDALTTKVGLAASLAEYATASGVDVESYFPRCYDLSNRVEREDFVQDFRTAAAIKVLLVHLHILDQRFNEYCCNHDVLKIAEIVARRLFQDLDANHLDESTQDTSPSVSEDMWDALILYSDFTIAQLCGKSEEECQTKCQRRRSHRVGGGANAETRIRDTGTEAEGFQKRPDDVKQWSEFRGHTWDCAVLESLKVFTQLACNLMVLFKQWPLQGGWLGRNVWIVKPGTNSKGSGVECTNSLPDILHCGQNMPNRIIQKYIERPLLLFSGRKFDIRQWVLVKSVQPLRVFMFSECYLRLCNGMYDIGNLRDRERHISNWQVNKHGRNVVKGAVESLDDFKKELLEISGREKFWEEHLFPKISEIIVHTCRAAQGRIMPRDRSFELFGFDIMIDEGFRPWLLEVNLSPGCDCRTPFLEKMLARMSRRLVEICVLGREEPDGDLPDWLPICSDPISHLSGESTVPGGRKLQPVHANLQVTGQALRPPRPRRHQTARTSEDSPVKRLATPASEISTQVGPPNPIDEGESYNDGMPSPKARPPPIDDVADPTGVCESNGGEALSPKDDPGAPYLVHPPIDEATGQNKRESCSDVAPLPTDDLEKQDLIPPPSEVAADPADERESHCYATRQPSEMHGVQNGTCLSIGSLVETSGGFKDSSPEQRISSEEVALDDDQGDPRTVGHADPEEDASKVFLGESSPKSDSCRDFNDSFDSDSSAE